jgi:CRISPR/Cas system-associated exonuclease Cas4 (RecB family)
LNWRLIQSDEDGNYLSLLRKVLKDWYSKPREGWHVTDIVMCPRRHAFTLIDPIPAAPGDREVNMYSSGKSIHEAIQTLFMSNRMRFEKEKYVEYNGVQGSVDIYDKKNGKPIEFKTLRAAGITQPKSFHVEQLKYYMSILDAPLGEIIYQCLLQFEYNPFVSFEISMTAVERHNQLGKLSDEINLLQQAIKMKNPAIARGVFLDKGMNWLCKDCPYLKNCKVIDSTPHA